jgi:hypothetical protein
VYFWRYVAFSYFDLFDHGVNSESYWLGLIFWRCSIQIYFQDETVLSGFSDVFILVATYTVGLKQYFQEC